MRSDELEHVAPSVVLDRGDGALVDGAGVREDRPGLVGRARKIEDGPHGVDAVGRHGRRPGQPPCGAVVSEGMGRGEIDVPRRLEGERAAHDRAGLVDEDAHRLVVGADEMAGELVAVLGGNGDVRIERSAGVDVDQIDRFDRPPHDAPPQKVAHVGNAARLDAHLHVVS